MFFFLYTPGDDPRLPVASLAASLMFAGVVYAFVYREILPETLPKDLRRELRRWPGKPERAPRETE